MAGHLHGDQTLEVKGSIVSSHTNKEIVWVGVFVGPITPESEAWSWTSIESKAFSLEIPQVEEDVHLVALRRNFVPFAIQVPPELHESEITFDFKKGQRFLGTVVSTDGIEITDAVLRIGQLNEPPLQIPKEVGLEWVSKADGTFSIGGLVPGKYEIQVALPCIPTESFMVQVMDGEDTQQELMLTDAYHVKGLVVDQFGKVVEGAEVRANLDPPVWIDISGNVVLSTEVRQSTNTGFLRFALSNTLTTTSSSKGAFLMGPFLYGQGLNISAVREAGGTTNSAKVFSGNHTINLMLSKLVGVFGTVLDAATGEAVDEFSVETHGRRKREFRHSESNGKISAQIDSAARAIVVSAPKYVPFFTTDLALDSVDEYDMGIVELDPGREVTGLVYDLESRQPIEGATIASLGRRIEEGAAPTGRSYFVAQYMESKINVKSDANGKFSLGPVPSEWSSLREDAFGYESLEVVAGSQTDIDIGLTQVDFQNTKIVGRVQTTHGNPVNGTVVFSDVVNHSGTTRRIKDDGRFEFSTVAGRYRVHAVSNRGRSKAIEVDVSNGKTENVVLVVDPFGRLVGTITGLERAEGASAMVLSENRNVQSTERISNGEFVLEGMGTGSFKVRVSTTMNRQIERSFELTSDADEAYADFVFGDDSRLYGKVLSQVDDDSNLQVRAIGKEKESISGWSDLLHDGSFEIRGLTDGEYWIEVGKRSTWGLGESNKDRSGTRIGIVVAGDTELNLNASTERANSSTSSP